MRLKIDMHSQEKILDILSDCNVKYEGIDELAFAERMKDFEFEIDTSSDALILIHKKEYFPPKPKKEVKICPKCRSKKLEFATLCDDFDGTLTCKKCGNQTPKWVEERC